MKFEDIKIGTRYWISYNNGKNPHNNYEGGAVCMMFYPPEYSDKTIEFRCDDGEMGYFEAEHVKQELPPLEEKVTITLQELTDAFTQMIESRNYYNNDCVMIFDSFAQSLGFKNLD